MLAYLLAIKMLKATKKGIQVSDKAAIYSRQIVREKSLQSEENKMEKAEERESQTSFTSRAKGLLCDQQ